MNNNINFIDILASTLHDTKNSLGLLSNTLAKIIESCQEKDSSLSQDFNLLQYEIKRLNHNQIRLLALYKAEKSQFSVNVDYHSVSECLEDVAIQSEPFLASKGIEIELDCPETLFWAFDRSLIGGILDNVLNNALRYTKEKVRISAGEVNGYLILSVYDNGAGYPASMLVNGEDDILLKESVDFNTGSTMLGLYFAKLVAGLHVNKERQGYIALSNGGQLGGGTFALYLP